MLFQSGALFSALSVLENVALPLLERGGLGRADAAHIARCKLAQVGLAAEDGDKLPAQLSGGMIKRAALARALALDPELLFLDEPTAGLDPLGAQAFVALIAELRALHGLTAVMVTHELERVAPLLDRVAVLADRRVVAIGPLAARAPRRSPLLFGRISPRMTRKGGEPWKVRPLPCGPACLSSPCWPRWRRW